MNPWSVMRWWFGLWIGITIYVAVKYFPINLAHVFLVLIGMAVVGAWVSVAGHKRELFEKRAAYEGKDNSSVPFWWSSNFVLLTGLVLSLAIFVLAMLAMVDEHQRDEERKREFEAARTQQAVGNNQKVNQPQTRFQKQNNSFQR